MEKEEMIRKLKENEKLIFVIGIVFISGLIVGISILVIKLPKSKPKYYIAIDDTYYTGADPTGAINGNNTSLIAGRYETNTSSSIYYTYIRFNIARRPRKWSMVEVSFFVSEYYRKYDVKMSMMFLDFEWNEQMTGWDIHTSKPFITSHISTQFYVGLHRFNITNYIDLEYESITMCIFGYGGNSMTGYYDNHIKIYSKEANVSKSYLPQLIWA